jgi:hypothetical protein
MFFVIAEPKQPQKRRKFSAEEEKIIRENWDIKSRQDIALMCDSK